MYKLCIHCFPLYSGPGFMHRVHTSCTVYMVCNLLLCLPVAANFYIVVSQGVVTVAFVLDMHVLVETSKKFFYVACYFH